MDDYYERWSELNGSKPSPGVARLALWLQSLQTSGFEDQT